jgi:flagellar protein FlaI
MAHKSSLARNALERRRLKAGTLFKNGETQAEEAKREATMPGDASSPGSLSAAQELAAPPSLDAPAPSPGVTVAPEPKKGFAAFTHKYTASLQQSLQKMGLIKGGKREVGGPNLGPLVQEDKVELFEAPRYREVDLYALNPPYAYVRVVYDEDEKNYIYQVVEPKLSPLERTVLAFVEDTLVNVLETSPHDLAARVAEGRQPTDKEEAKALEEYITDRFNEALFDYSIVLDEDEKKEEESKKRLLYYIRRDFIGHGRIDVLMDDPLIEDISCDGPHQPIFLYHRKYESVRSSVKFRDDDELDSFVIKLAQRAGKHISIAEPILDATMTDGSRLQSTLSHEVSAMGSTFTIRKFRSEPFTPPDLVAFRTVSAEMLAYLWIAVQNGSSAIYAGGTASGKTTSLNAVLLFIPQQMKIVSIEDTRELNLPHPNWIAGITRSGFGARNIAGLQAGEIDMFQLLKNALRQRPEYIIVGEVRGKEAYSLFQAMATGHAAYGTMHADSVDAVIHRLESEPINIPRSLLEALDIVSVQIQTRVGGKRVRRTKQLSEIVGLDPHTREILTNEVFRWVPKDDTFKYSGVSYVLERIRLEKGMQPGEMQQEMDRRAFLVRYMVWKQMRNYREVWRIVTSYYRGPEETIAKVKGALLDAGVDIEQPGWEFQKSQGAPAAAPSPQPLAFAAIPLAAVAPTVAAVVSAVEATTPAAESQPSPSEPARIPPNAPQARFLSQEAERLAAEAKKLRGETEDGETT